MGHLTFPGSLDLPVEACNNPAGRVALVEGMGELLASCLQLLAESERVQHACILCGCGGRAGEPRCN